MLVTIWRSLASVIFMCGAAQAVLAQHEQTESNQSSLDSASEIIVTANRLADVQVDYRFIRPRLTICRAREGEHDMQAVRVVCAYIRECMKDHRLLRVELSDCVNRSISNSGWQEENN